MKPGSKTYDDILGQMNYSHKNAFHMQNKRNVFYDNEKE